MSKNSTGTEQTARGNKENGDFEEMERDQNGRNRQKRKVDANRTKETGRDLITQGHEDQVKVLELILRAK